MHTSTALHLTANDDDEDEDDFNDDDNDETASPSRIVMNPKVIARETKPKYNCIPSDAGPSTLISISKAL